MAHFLKSNGLYDLLVTRGNWRAVFPLLPQNNSILHCTVILWNWKYTHYWGSVWPKTNKSGDFIFGTNLLSALGLVPCLSVIWKTEYLCPGVLRLIAKDLTLSSVTLKWMIIKTVSVLTQSLLYGGDKHNVFFEVLESRITETMISKEIK